MPDANISDGPLRALRDLGVNAVREDELDRRCRSALQREIDLEHRAGRRVRSGRRRGVLPGRRGLIVALTAATLAAGGGAGYAALSNPAESSAGVDCQSDATAGGNGTIVPVDGRPATEICAQLWAKGVVGDGARIAPAPLHACVNPSGSDAIHVVPSAQADACARIGLQEAPNAGADPAAQQYAAFQSKLSGSLDGLTCPSESVVRETIQQDLAAAGLAGWTIMTDGSFDSQRPCASIAISSGAHKVTIIPINR
jgi:hypothetical protein